MDKSTTIGIIAGLSLIFGAIFMGTGWATFFDPGSLVIVLGGTGSALLVNFTMDDMRGLPKQIKGFFQHQPPAYRQYVEQFSNLSRMSRRDGLLALDDKLSEMEDELMRFGIEQAVDGRDEEEIESMLTHQIDTDEKALDRFPAILTKAGTFAPAFGMIGTLIGLIQMMQNLDDPTQIGQGMATAMITTFYGALLANLLFLPMASKAKDHSSAVKLKNDMVLTGVLSIVRGENPSVVERRLDLFLGNDGEGDGTGEPAHLSKVA